MINIIRQNKNLRMRTMSKVILMMLLIVLSASKLYQVSSLFRHGARYHLNALYDGNSTHDIWGELTPVGMRQHQTLGKTLHREYIQTLGFLSPKFNKKQIQVISTGYNRTIQSALSQLYGLYPPGNGPTLQPAAPQYHLPPFTNTSDIDQPTFAFPHGHQHILIKYDPTLMAEVCPKYNQLVQINLNLHKQQYDEMTLTYTPFIKKTIQVFGLPANSTLINLSSLFDTLIVDKFMGRQLPSGYTEGDLMNLQHLHNWLNNVKFQGTIAKVINSRRFAKILSDFDTRITHPTTPLKWTFYSAHDTDVLPFQTALNFSSFQCIQDLYRKGKTDALNCQTDVGFASSIIFELHSDNGQDFYVMIRSQGKYMNLCGRVDTKCGYNEWKGYMKNLIINNVDEVCGIKKGMLGEMAARSMESFEAGAM